MGFLESLSRKLEAEALVRKQNEETIRTAKQAAEASCLQKRAQEEAVHQQRREQAGAFREESKIDSLLSKLAGLIDGDLCSVYGPGNSAYLHSGSDGRINWPTRLQDPDSDRSHFLRWDVVSLGDVYPEKNSDYYYERFVGKYIAVECCPEGTIIFHAGKRGSSTLTRAQWRSNPDSLEASLESAYSQPGDYEYHDSKRKLFGGLSGFG